MPLYKDWDQFEKPSKIKVYLNNGKTLEINPLKLKGGKRVYDAILQAFIDDRFDITNKVVQGMTDSLSEAKGTLCGRCGHVHVKGTPCPRPFKEGEELTEAYVPSNIKKFAKEKGVSSLVNKVAGWAEQVGKGIRGGTAIGKNYSTLVLDMTHEGSEIRINTEDNTITLYDEPVRSFNEFQRVYADGAGNNLEEAKPDYLDLDKDGNKAEPMKKAAKDAEKGIKENKQNDFIAKIDPKHPLATKDVEEWNDGDMKKYKELWDKHHGNSTMKDMLKKAVTTKLKEAGPMSPEDKKATDLEIQAQKAKIAAANHRIQNLQKGDALTENHDFFEKTLDDDNYVDVSGQSVEMTMEEILADFEERIKDIPEESREEALGAIKTLWITMIKQWNPDLVTPHRASITEAKHPIFESKEYDYEGQMARTQLISIVKNAKALFDSIDNNTQLQSWVQSKLTKAEDYIEAVSTYLEGESLTSTTPVVVAENGIKDEEGVSLSVGDVVKAGDGGIYQIIFSYGESKPFLVPFDLKKRKPLNLRNRIYFDSDSVVVKKLHKILPYSATKGGFMK